MIAFEKIVLKNGLTVLHHLDEKTPFVVVNILYNIGAKHEQKHKTGFAHLFEHLMFGGTKLFPNFDHPLQDAGGENNAFTNNDYTNYYDVVPKENIEIALCLEADRMSNLDINPKSLDVQKKVVIEEFKEHYINQPYGNVWHLLREMCYEQHPYQWPTIGKNVQQIEEATLDDVTDFYKKYYQPNNAFLVIAGNIEKENAFELTQKYFESISFTQVDTQKFEEPLQLEAKSKTTYQDIPLNAFYLAFKMTEKMHQDFYIADTISDILSTGTSSRLYENLVKNEKAFVEIDAYITASNDVGLFVIEGKIAADCAVERAEALVWNELEKLKTTLILDKEMQKIKNKMLTYMQFSEASLLNRAIALAYFELLGDANQINQEIEAYEKVNPMHIQKFAQQYFTKERSNTLYYLKQK
jgi:zinc protease